MSCSLVCSDWLSSSRLHMFDNLEIYRALSAAKRMNMHVFFKLIDDPHNTRAFVPFLCINVAGDGFNILVRKLVDADVHLVKLAITVLGDEVCLRDFSPLNTSITSLDPYDQVSASVVGKSLLLSCLSPPTSLHCVSSPLTHLSRHLIPMVHSSM